MSLVDQVLDEWNRGIDPKYFHGDSRFQAKPSDYTTKELRSNSPQFVLPQPVLFNPGHTAYGLALRAQKKERTVNAAVLGFNVADRVADCLEIHGGKGMYGSLSPVWWDGVLLKSLIEVARQAELSAVAVLSAHMVEGMDAANAERLKRRYDQNAARHKFSYSKSMERFVLDL